MTNKIYLVVEENGEHSDWTKENRIASKTHQEAQDWIDKKNLEKNEQERVLHTVIEYVNDWEIKNRSTKRNSHPAWYENRTRARVAYLKENYTDFLIKYNIVPETFVHVGPDDFHIEEIEVI